MRGFLTALLLSGLAGILFANTGNAPLLTDGPVMSTEAVAQAGAGAGAASASLMR